MQTQASPSTQSDLNFVRRLYGLSPQPAESLALAANSDDSSRAPSMTKERRKELLKSMRIHEPDLTPAVQKVVDTAVAKSNWPASHSDFTRTQGELRELLTTQKPGGHMAVDMPMLLAALGEFCRQGNMPMPANVNQA